MRVGNDNPSTTRWPRGRVGSLEIYETALSLAQADNARRGVFPAKHFIVPGRNGLVNVPDITGNGATCTITGLTSDDLAPGPPNGGRSAHYRQLLAA